MIRLISQILIWIAFPGSVAFPVMYAIFTRKHYDQEPWYATDMGRHLMSFSVTILIAYLNSVIVLLFRDYPGRPIVSMLLGAAVAGMVWWRVVLYVRYRFRRRKGKHHVDNQILERRTGEMPENGSADVSSSTGN